jgi:O-antigen/teichoic acid export membrane protein
MAGLYSVSYDLALKSLHTLTIAIDLAAFPLVVRAMESSGVEAARRQLRSNGTLLLAIIVPAATGLWMLSGPVIQLFVGETYRETAALVFPLIVLAAFFAGFGQAHFQHAFTLGRRTMLLALLMGIASVANVGLNLALIPVFGVAGAAYASVAAFALLMLLSWAVGRRVFPVPMPWRSGACIVLASAVMGAVLLFLEPPRTTIGLLVQIGLGALVYAAALLALNPDRYRTRLLALLRPASGGNAS